MPGMLDRPENSQLESGTIQLFQQITNSDLAGIRAHEADLCHANCTGHRTERSGVEDRILGL